MAMPTKQEIYEYMLARFTDYWVKSSRLNPVIQREAFEDGFEAGVMYCADMVIKSRDEADAARKED